MLEGAVSASPFINETQQEEILERFSYLYVCLYVSLSHSFFLFKPPRFQDYIPVVQQNGNYFDLEDLGETIVETTSDIIDLNPSDGVLDEVF